MNQKLHVELNDVKAFKAVMEAVENIQEEIKLKFSKEKGIQCSMMDNSHICLFNFEIPYDDLNAVKTENNEVVEVGVNVKSLNKILKRLDNDAMIVIELSDNAKFLNLTFKDENTKKAKIFQVPTIVIDVEEINVEALHNIEFSNMWKVPFSYMKEVIGDSEILSEVLTFRGLETGLHFSVMTETSGNYEQLFEKGQLIDSKFEQESECSYSIHFLKSVMKAENILGTSRSKKKNTDNGFILKLKSETPAYFKIEFYNNSFIEYYLAPRVEQDNEEEEEDNVPSPQVKSPSNPASVRDLTLEDIKKVFQINAQKMRDMIQSGLVYDQLEEEIPSIQSKITNLQSNKKALIMEDKVEEALDCSKQIIALTNALNEKTNLKSEIEALFIIA